MSAARRRTASGVIVASLMLASGIATTGVAWAQTHSASVTGSSAWSKTTWIYNKDTARDSHASRSNWNSGSGSGGMDNSSGYGATASKNTGKDITAVQACTYRTLQPMDCSSWNNIS